MRFSVQKILLEMGLGVRFSLLNEGSESFAHG